MTTKTTSIQLLVGTVLTLLLNASAVGACVCRCTNGENVPICSGPIDLPPICPPVVCPLAPPSIQPIQQPIIPPAGTTDCWKQQVLSPITGRYEWKTICK